jgi:hypothetical protein
MKGIRKELLNSYLYEFMWFERFEINGFENIIEHIRRYYISEEE